MKEFSKKYYGEYLDLRFVFERLMSEFKFFMYSVEDKEEKEEFEKIFAQLREVKYKIDTIDFES